MHINKHNYNVYVYKQARAILANTEHATVCECTLQCILLKLDFWLVRQIYVTIM